MTVESALPIREHTESATQPREHSFQPLTAPLLEGSDLILTMTRDHRRHAVGIAPRKHRRTFTVGAFDSLIQALGDDRLAIVAELTAAGRLNGLMRQVADTRTWSTQ
jgi:protein-tyrosine phosphatase